MKLCIFLLVALVGVLLALVFAPSLILVPASILASAGPKFWGFFLVGGLAAVLVRVARSDP